MDIMLEDPGKLQNLLPKWKSKKIINADKITDIDVAGIPFDGYIILTTANGTRIKRLANWYVKHEPNVGGYIVVYEDGYTSYSPAEPFEKGNDPIS